MELQDLVNSHFKRSELKRYDEAGENLEVSFYLDIQSKDSLSSFREAVNAKDPSVRVAFIDNNI